DQILVREGALRVLVETLHVRVRRRRIEVVVVLLDVLAVVPLAVGEPEQALLEDGIPAVPERYRETELLPVVGDAGDAVLAPAVGARARVIVRCRNDARRREASMSCIIPVDAATRCPRQHAPNGRLCGPFHQDLVTP